MTMQTDMMFRARKDFIDIQWPGSIKILSEELMGWA
jgi:hypothetical protein